MFGLVLSSATWVKIVCYGLIAAVVLGWLTYAKVEWDAGQRAIHTVAAVKAETKAVAAGVAKADAGASKNEKAAQRALSASTAVIIKRIPIYVHVSTPGKPVPCVSWGLVRLHDAAVLGVDPASLSNPGGAADDACSTVTDVDLATAWARNYGAARANAEQLDALEADIKARAAAAALATHTPSSGPDADATLNRAASVAGIVSGITGVVALIK